VKLILDVRSTPVETVGFRGFLRAFWYRAAVLIAKGFFGGMTVITPMMKEEICEGFEIDPGFVGVWTSGVSPMLFDSEKYEKESIALRQELGLTGNFVILYHGNFGLKRGIVETIESIARLKRDYPDVVLFLLGSGSGLSQIEKKIQKSGIQDRVIICKSVDYTEVPKYIAMCDVGIIPLPDLPDWRNQCPLKLLEYLSMKKPVILTDIPAHREVIGKEKCGVFISSTDPVEIARAIAYVRSNMEKLEIWGSCGRLIIDKKYCWNRVAENLDDYLTSLKSAATTG
jgi:glycosyltransferase involved in cell wall biosynthesis